MMIVHLGTSNLETEFGDFEFSAWYDGISEFFAIHTGALSNAINVPCRIHSSCIGSHYFNGTACDCTHQLAIAQKSIADQGLGLIIVLQQEAKGNGTICTANYGDYSAGTRSSVEVFERMGRPGDNRDYRQAADAIKYFEIRSIVLLSNSPTKQKNLETHGINVESVSEIKVDLSKNQHLTDFYRGKQEIEGHK